VAADSSTLEIDEVFAEDGGDYCVVASNAAGEARTACHVYVTAALPSTLQSVGAVAAAAADDDDDDVHGSHGSKSPSETEQHVASIRLSTVPG